MTLLLFAQLLKAFGLLCNKVARLSWEFWCLWLPKFTESHNNHSVKFVKIWRVVRHKTFSKATLPTKTLFGRHVLGLVLLNVSPQHGNCLINYEFVLGPQITHHVLLLWIVDRNKEINEVIARPRLGQFVSNFWRHVSLHSDNNSNCLILLMEICIAPTITTASKNCQDWAYSCLVYKLLWSFGSALAMVTRVW